MKPAPEEPRNALAIRDATLGDHAVYAQLFPELAIDDPIISADRYRTEMMPTTFVATHDGSVAGYAFYRPMADTVHVSHLVVAPEARRRGVGRALLERVADRSRALGCERMRLNVKPDNQAAITLYQGFGLAVQYRSRAIKIAWQAVETLPEEATPFTALATEVKPEDDARLERQVKVMRGVLAEGRARGGRTILKIEHDGQIALGVFDRGFPGVYPIRAPDGPYALSLLRAFRPHADQGDPIVHVMIEDQSEVAASLLAAGATLKLEVLTMEGALPNGNDRRSAS